MTTWVSTRSSLIGSSVTPGSQRRHRAAVTSQSGIARREHLAAYDVGGEVAVTEPEPGRPDAVERELVAYGVGLVGPAPALFLVDATAEGVHDRVQVGADPQPEKGDVVGGVADHGDLRVGDGGAQPAQEAGGTDAAGGDHDMHAGAVWHGDESLVRTAKYHRSA